MLLHSLLDCEDYIDRSDTSGQLSAVLNKIVEILFSSIKAAIFRGAELCGLPAAILRLLRRRIKVTEVIVLSPKNELTLSVQSRR